MIFQRLKNIIHFFEAFIANYFYGFPSKKLKVIGVTGTDGKTTTVHLIYHILERSGKKTSFISSIHAQIGNRTFETGFHITTPRPWIVQKLLKQSVDAGDEYFILETTSHAIDQGRIWGIEFDMAVLTNISQDHLYHHGTFENYMALKMLLLLMAGKAVINADDSSFKKVKQALKDNNKDMITYSLSKGPDVDFFWHDSISTLIKGDYNRQNIMAAYACCHELGISDEDIIKAVETFLLPVGRFDVVYDDDFKVIIDFAHTPKGIENVLKTLEKDNDERRIIHVFGAASERDDGKRPLMGEASGKYADIVILTEEDYRKEDFNNICDMVAQGLIKYSFFEVSPDKLTQIEGKSYTRVRDRANAISLAIEIAKTGDVIVATGKGHEKSLNREGKEYPWDEYKAVQDAITKIS